MYRSDSPPADNCPIVYLLSCVYKFHGSSFFFAKLTSFLLRRRYNPFLFIFSSSQSSPTTLDGMPNATDPAGNPFWPATQIR